MSWAILSSHVRSVAELSLNYITTVENGLFGLDSALKGGERKIGKATCEPVALGNR